MSLKKNDVINFFVTILISCTAFIGNFVPIAIGFIEARESVKVKKLFFYSVSIIVVMLKFSLATGVYYAINILGQKPDTSKNIKFNDVTDKQNSDYDNAVTLSYQLWIMWQNIKNNNFRPNYDVTRAEFATALSRMLYNIEDGKRKQN